MGCAKIGYESRKSANQDAQNMLNQYRRFTKRRKNNRKAGSKLRPYQCPICHEWHLTSAKQKTKIRRYQ